MTPRPHPIATRVMPGLYGTEIRVPAYVVVEPRKRGQISAWLRDMRERGK